MIISTIGSCRVAGPMTKLQAQRSFVLDNRLLYGFTHNTKETIQAIRFMRGELRLPESLWPFISDQPFRNGNSTPHAPDAHYVVEISSVKVLELDGLYLQLVRFKEALSVCPDLRKIFFDHPGAEQRGQRLQLLQATPSFARLATHIQHALTHTVVRSQTAAEIEEDLHTIAQLLGPKLVLVTHCNAKNATGELIAERAKMVARVAQAAARLGLVSVDPGALLAGFGQERGMPDEGLDTAHYTPAFAKLVGKEISDKLLGPAMTEDAADSLHNLDFRACMERSKQSAQAHEWDLALLFANRAIELKPGSGSAYVLRARAVTALDQTEDMLEAWSLALATESNRTPYVLRQAGEAAFYMRDHERAREWAEASLQKEDDDKTALLLGRVYTRLGMNAQAEQVFRRCAASDPARSLRFAARAHTPLADAASMVNALTTTPAADPGSVDGVRQTVLKRATREVRHAGRAGALLPSLGAFYAVRTLPSEHGAAHDADLINQAYRRLLRAYEGTPEYQNSDEAIALLADLAALPEVDPRYIQRAAKMLHAHGRKQAAAKCWEHLAGVELPAGRDTVALAASKLSQLEAHRTAASVYRRLANSGAMDTATAQEYIDKCLRALARSVRACITEERLRDAEQALASIREIDAGYAGLTSLQRSLSEAHKREFRSQRAQAANPADLMASARRIIEASPLDRDANIELAVQNLRTGNLSESRRILEQFLQSAPA